MTVAVDLLIQLREELQNTNLKELRLIISEYSRIDRRISAQIEAFVSAIPENATSRSVQKMPEFKRLMEQVNSELTGHVSWMKGQLEQEGTQNVETGSRNSLLLLGTALAMAMLPGGSDEELLALGGELSQGLTSVNSLMIEQLLEFLRPDGELFRRLEMIPGLAVEKMVQTIIDGIGSGMNPLKLVKLLSNDFGIPLSDSLRMIRTLQIWAYREANRANYIANGIESWIWYAALDGTTCLSCWDQHGTIHPVTESLDDHHNGRCTPVPVVEGVDYGIENGNDLWNAQSDEFKLQSAGPMKFQSLQDGLTILSDYSVQRPDDVYGTIRFEQSQKQVLAAQGK